MWGEIQGDERKRSTYEVSKGKRWRQNWRLVLLQGKSRGNLRTALSGVRHRGGVNPNQTLWRNVGTCRPNAKGATQVEDPREWEYWSGVQRRTNP